MVVRRPASSKAARRATPGLSPADDRLLVEAAQRDPSRFAELYEVYFERVYVFIVRRVSNRDVAEDLTSDVFHKALANIRRFEWRGVPFVAWLFRIAANAIADRSRHAAKEVAGIDDPPDATSEMDLEGVEHRARLFRLVDQLPSDQRRVIFQRFVEQRSVREVAQELGRSEGAVKQLQFRALEKLRAQMEGANA
jgi:RNA polymerase sigma-70 factor, ECF subfamily